MDPKTWRWTLRVQIIILFFVYVTVIYLSGVSLKVPVCLLQERLLAEMDYIILSMSVGSVGNTLIF